MSHELYYTSAPSGLKPGSRGFCTVAMTRNLSAQWVDRLESLSGYRFAFEPGSPEAHRNPVQWAHWRVTVGGNTRSVLSRVASAGSDYTGRSNKFAHHVLLEPSEQAPAGPAAILQRPDFMQSALDGEPRLFETGKSIPMVSREGRICKAWERATGDAGWAGIVAESFINHPEKPVVVLCDPETEVLALFDEALALLPVVQRWQVSFNTYFTELPAGQECHWRGVLVESVAAKEALRQSSRFRVVYATKACSLQESSALVEFARTGIPPQSSPGERALENQNLLKNASSSDATGGQSFRNTRADKISQPKSREYSVQLAAKGIGRGGETLENRTRLPNQVRRKNSAKLLLLIGLPVGIVLIIGGVVLMAFVFQLPQRSEQFAGTAITSPATEPQQLSPTTAPATNITKKATEPNKPVEIANITRPSSPIAPMAPSPANEERLSRNRPAEDTPINADRIDLKKADWQNCISTLRSKPSKLQIHFKTDGPIPETEQTGTKIKVSESRKNDDTIFQIVYQLDSINIAKISPNNNGFTWQWYGNSTQPERLYVLAALASASADVVIGKDTRSISFSKILGDVSHEIRLYDAPQTVPDISHCKLTLTIESEPDWTVTTSPESAVWTVLDDQSYETTVDVSFEDRKFKVVLTSKSKLEKGRPSQDSLDVAVTSFGECHLEVLRQDIELSIQEANAALKKSEVALKTLKDKIDPYDPDAAPGLDDKISQLRNNKNQSDAVRARITKLLNLQALLRQIDGATALRDANIDTLKKANARGVNLTASNPVRIKLCEANTLLCQLELNTGLKQIIPEGR